MASVRNLRKGVDLVAARAATLQTPRVAIGSTFLRRELSSAVRPAVRTASKRSIVPTAISQVKAPAVRYASGSSEALHKTQLYDLHEAHGAKMVPFAGYSMPLQYADLSHVESHMWTREKASLFDVSHMVQHHLSGPGALELLMKITPSSLDKLTPNTSTLSCLLEEGTGGIVDDTVITRRGEDQFYFVTNAGRRAEDLAFLQAEIDAYRAQNGADSIKWDILEDRALIALQGPLAVGALQPLINGTNTSTAETDLSTLYFGQCRELHLTLPDGTATKHPFLISRTGYTGEDGFEISIPTSGAPTLPQQVVELLLRDNNTVRLAGLAARDSLRLEAGMCLYGHDISTSQTPPAAALGWVVSRDRRDAATATFNGASAILPQIASPAKTLTQRRVGLSVEKGPPAREGAIVVDLSDPASPVDVGVVTSGLPSPSLGGANIAMAYVKQGLHKKGTEVGVRVRNKVRKASVVGMPWVESKFHRPS
ncbi:hypothetical protein N7492_010385 [Penicillium capsulatum]|uniref:Aminomethyltransferase n=1 Tax=Penicillium capsulatum TaxID=69766 RepID=A0A9W9LFE4_9EURO|nr:hypothetical protein N7492_010385 [Penicillium capsulatum]KAJ6112889.1 hypothetical protein N7512_008213 [Penicillium capsulatum]